MKRLLTYGLLLLTILASHFVVSACQDDLPETTEVMMTFTTRAVVSDIISSDAPDKDKMKDLRVIMLRQNGTVVDNHLVPEINASSVTFTFTTPIQTGGEDFTFLAVANEGSIQSESELSWLNCNPGDNLSSTLSAIKAQQIGDGTAFDINDGPIPQTKQWTVHVPQTNNHKENQTLDFVASKISVQFINTYDAAQTLSNIHITGITPNGWGSLFNRPTGKKDDKGEEIYEEVYVTENSDVTLTDGKIDFGRIDVGAATNEGSTPTSSVIHHYYSYPVDKDNISSPTLHATWNGKNYTLPLEGITELKRNDHLKIVVTLTGHALTINYSIAPWVEEATNIGSPTTNGGYQVDGWGNGNDIIIGGEIGGGEEPEPEPGDTIWRKTLSPSLTLNYGAPNSIELKAADLSNFVSGRFLGVVYSCSGDNGVLCVQKRTDEGGWDSKERNLPSQPGRITVYNTKSSYEFELTADDVTAINNGDGLGIWGGGITVTKIYIKAPATQ